MFLKNLIWINCIKMFGSQQTASVPLTPATDDEQELKEHWRCAVVAVTFIG